MLIFTLIKNEDLLHWAANATTETECNKNTTRVNIVMESKRKWEQIIITTIISCFVMYIKELN